MPQTIDRDWKLTHINKKGRRHVEIYYDITKTNNKVIIAGYSLGIKASQKRHFSHHQRRREIAKTRLISTKRANQPTPCRARMQTERAKGHNRIMRGRGHSRPTRSLRPPLDIPCSSRHHATRLHTP